MRVPSAATEDVCAPAVTLTVGSPNRAASAGARKSGFRPLAATVTEPSGKVVNVPGPDVFSVMLFPVVRFVNEEVKEPVTSSIVEPSGVLRSLPYLVGREGHPDREPAERRVQGERRCGHNLPFRAPAQGRGGCQHPSGMPSSAPSATINPTRRTAITSTLGPPHVALL